MATSGIGILNSDWKSSSSTVADSADRGKVVLRGIPLLLRFWFLLIVFPVEYLGSKILIRFWSRSALQGVCVSLVDISFSFSSPSIFSFNFLTIRSISSVRLSLANFRSIRPFWRHITNKSRQITKPEKIVWMNYSKDPQKKYDFPVASCCLPKNVAVFVTDSRQTSRQSMP